MKSLLVMVMGLMTAGLVGAYAGSHLNSLVVQPTTSQSLTASSGNLPRAFSWSGSGRSGNNATTTSQSVTNSTVNWAGYQASGGTFTGVSGSWVVPSASSSNGETAADATWVGIGGVTSSDLIQVGTQNVVAPGGQVSTSAFYEMLPDSSQTIPSLNINPGDSISASITEIAPDEWSVTLKDNTTNESYTTTVAYDSSLSSAEWIEEDPSDGVSQQIPFDNFVSLTFDNASTIENGSNVSIAGSHGQALTMINYDGQALASTSSLGSNGNSFTVTRTSASSGPGISQFNQYPNRWVRRGIGIGRFSGGFGRL